MASLPPASLRPSAENSPHDTPQPRPSAYTAGFDRRSLSSPAIPPAPPACRESTASTIPAPARSTPAAIHGRTRWREKAAENYKNRARANLDAVRLFELFDPKKAPDGVYTANSTGYAGEIVVEVTVQGGRIEAVEVKRHSEKQFYASMIDTPAKIIQRQSVKGIDATSGATLTSEAIINATAKALVAAAKK